MHADFFRLGDYEKLEFRLRKVTFEGADFVCQGEKDEYIV